MDVIKHKINDLESELEPWRKLGRENEALETQLYALKRQLKRMEQRQGEMTDEH
ncbi:hypothetical protein [Rodentibacter sp. Ppn85]|uniref:hypothetical protein n=1 Tax=Rodentibacter sp. Ppn85 TaxID=1908525 RepID=UPI001E2F5C10|nr:hypothetical protein [Rodentibacter sp. Ppn85]